MQKIYTKALELAGFKNANEIVSVIMATPNPRVATEIILGCYVPNIEAIGFYKRNDTLFKVIEVDELNDIIKFEKITQKTKTVYFANEQDKKNDIYSDERLKDYYSYKELPIAGTNTYEDSEKFDTFMNGYNKKNRIEESEFVNTLIQWNYNPNEFAMV
jgi:hypothetical protein